MPITKSKFKYAIICDDIRHEIGNKLSFIGVYSKDLFIPKIPFTFPKLCIYLFYEKVKGGVTMNAKLIDPSGKKVGQEIVIEVPKDVKKPQALGMSGIFAPLRIEQDGTYKFEVRFRNGREYFDYVDFAIKIREQ